MRTFLHLTTRLMVVCVFTLLITRLIGSTQTLPFSLIFRDPDNHPCVTACLFGIQPGETSVADAIMMLKHHPLTWTFSPSKFDTATRMQFLGDGMIVSLERDTSGIVQQIDLTFDYIDDGYAMRPISNRFHYGDMIAMLGAPDFYTLEQSYLGPRSISYYSEKSTTFTHQQRTRSEINPEDRLVSISVAEGSISAHFQHTYPWLGFGNVGR